MWSDKQHAAHNMAAPLTDRIAGWVVDQQLRSPLYTRIPPEIRLIIFELALAPCYEGPTAHDFRVRYDHGHRRADGALSESAESAQFTDGGSGEGAGDDEIGVEGEDASDAAEEEVALPFLSWDFDHEDSDDGSFEGDPTRRRFVRGPPPREWLRPDNVEIQKPSAALLRTCRWVYLEARDRLVPPDFELRLVYGRHPASRHKAPWETANKFYSSLNADQRNSVRSARIFTGKYDYAGPSGIESLCRSFILRRIEHLRITIDHPVRACLDDSNPFDRRGYVSFTMDRTTGFGHGSPLEESPDAEWEPPILWGRDGWAALFRYTPRLKTLLIDFEAHEEMFDGTRERVEWAARVWRFPLWSPRPDGCTYLSAQGNPVREISWRGCGDNFTNVCPRCSGIVAPSRGKVVCMCDYASDRLHLFERDLGPRMYRWTVKWTPRVGRPWVEPSEFEESVPWKPDGRWRWEEGEEVPYVHAE